MHDQSVEGPVSRWVSRPWSTFTLIPNKTGTIVFSQQRSNKLLTATIPALGSQGNEAPVFCFATHRTAVSASCVTGNGALLASGSADGAIRLFHVYDG